MSLKISQLTTATPASADLIPFVDVDDNSTAPAGAGGSDKATTLANLLGAGPALGIGTAWVNVISKGADPTGSADSTTAGQNAINACSAAGGGIVYFPTGTYKATPVSATVPAWKVPSNVALVGDGMGATTILKSGNGILIDFSGQGPISKTNNWSINQGLRDLAINCNNMTGLCLRLYYVQFYYESRVRIYGNAEVAVDMAQCFDSRVDWGLYQYGGSSSASAISGGQAVTHLIRCSAAPHTTLSAPISGTITSLPVNALPAALPAGVVQVWHGANVQNFTTTGAAASATSIPVSSTLVTLPGVTTGDTVNGFGWSDGNTNELKMFGCHWEDQISGSIWITEGVDNTSIVNNIRLIGSKVEQDNIGYNCPQIQVDSATGGISIDHLYFYAGGFNGGYSTAVTGIQFHPGWGTLSNVDMGNGASATITSGIDVAQVTLRPNVLNINQYWTTSPTVAGINVSGATVNLTNIQIGGTVSTAIAGGGNYSYVNDNNGNWGDVGTLAAGQTTAFGGFIAAGVTGATAASRYAGATATGAPASGTFAKGDFVVTQNGHLFICTTAGSPGTWTDAGSAGGVTIDGTTGDIAAAPGTAAAGSVGKAADAGHVHPQPTVFAPTGNTGAVQASRYAGATTSGHPTTGTYAVGDYTVDQTGSFWICTGAGTPGTWIQVVAGSVAPGGVSGPPYDAYLTGASVLAQTYPRYTSGASVSGALATGQTYCVAVGLPKGLVVSNIGTIPSSVSATQTHGWVGILNSSFTVLAVSADQGSTNMFPTANVATAFALSAPYTIPSTGLYYLVISQTATTVLGMYILTQAFGNAVLPFMAATRSTQNAPPSVSSTLGSTSSATSLSYVYVS